MFGKADHWPELIGYNERHDIVTDHLRRVQLDMS